MTNGLGTKQTKTTTNPKQTKTTTTIPNQTATTTTKRTSLLADVGKSIGLEILHNSWVQVGSRLSDLREALVVPPVVGTI